MEPRACLAEDFSELQSYRVHDGRAYANIELATAE